jgi:hypothetical protein
MKPGKRLYWPGTDAAHIFESGESPERPFVVDCAACRGSVTVRYKDFFDDAALLADEFADDVVASLTSYYAVNTLRMPPVRSSAFDEYRVVSVNCPGCERPYAVCGYVQELKMLFYVIELQCVIEIV